MACGKTKNGRGNVDAVSRQATDHTLQYGRMKIYCSGIGGIGLSAFAALQRARGHDVMGSDRSASALTQDLESQGITIVLNQDGTAIPPDCDLFVFSEAIPKDSPERMRAAALHIRSISYFEALG